MELYFVKMKPLQLQVHKLKIAKNVIYQNSSQFLKDLIGYVEIEKTNLNSHNIKLNINNPILASLKNNLRKFFK